MRAVLQRVSRARVRVGGETVGQIGNGLVILLGVGRDEDAAAAERLATKIAQLRIFENESGKFDRSLLDVGGEALVVSQFTLLADLSKGNRPSFSGAAPPEQAEPLYEAFCGSLRRRGISVETGVFGARMEVELVNDGPVTVILHV
ncbi:MAG TPA: D-aminoacyl-tRNA deacylase [Gaiellaceae bacterium]